MKVFLDRDAAKFIQKLQKDEKERTLRRIKHLKLIRILARRLRVEKTCSMRVGDFRIIYEIYTDIQEVWVLKVDFES